MNTKKKNSFFISLILVVAFMLSSFGGIFFATHERAKASTTGASVTLDVGDTFFFGEYPQSQVAEEDAGELIVWINQLKSTCGLSLFNSDGTSNIEYTDTTSANHVSKIQQGACAQLLHRRGGGSSHP